MTTDTSHHRNITFIASQYSCLTCSLLDLRDSETQREHYRSDWHRYNLKRKVASLPALTYEDFQSRLLLYQNQETKQKDNTKEKVPCPHCSKLFSQRGYENHLHSGKHDEALRQEVNISSTLASESTLSSESSSVSILPSSELMEVEEVTPEPNINECLFCSATLSNYQDCIQHMVTRHSFFIPDVEYLVDVEGLLAFLWLKVNFDYICIYCHKDFYSSYATKNHMKDKGHTIIGFENGGEEEVAQFYDFTEANAKWDNDVEDEEENDSEFEDIDPEMVVDLENPNVKESRELFSHAAIITEDESELILPSGKRIGHRNYRRYYKQYLRPANRPTDTDVEMIGGQPSLSLSTSLALRGREREARLALEKSAGIYPSSGIKTKSDMIDQKSFCRKISKKMMKLGTHANKLQKHYREQIL